VVRRRFVMIRYTSVRADLSNRAQQSEARDIDGIRAAGRNRDRARRLAQDYFVAAGTSSGDGLVLSSGAIAYALRYRSPR
jgi:hypothetical protein